MVGGGFGGASAARFIKMADPAIAVTLVEANPTFTACPFSNGVIVGLARSRAQQFSYEKLAAAGVTLAFQPATGVDPQARSVTLERRNEAAYDRLVLAPGIDIDWKALPGYDESRRRDDAARLEGRRADAAAAPPARRDGGRRHGRDVGAGQSVPLPAAALRAREPDRVLPQDQEAEVEADHPRRQGHLLASSELFQNAWKELYPDHLEWVSLSQGGKVTSVEPATKTFETDFDNVQGKRRQRRSRRKAPAHRADRRRRRPHRLVPDRSGRRSN